MRARRRRVQPLVGVMAGLLLLPLAACSDDDTTAADDSAVDSGALSGTCPDTVVIQTNWYPQAEYGGVYNMFGKDATIDKGKKAVRGSLMDGDVDTGVDLEVRSGGPANGFQPAAQVLYTDDSVMLGGVDTDQAIQMRGLEDPQPVVSVFAPLDLSPLVIMWDPKAQPEWNTIVDIGQSDAKVLYFQGATYMDYLTGSGVLKESQVDASYDGSPSRFVAEGGKVAQQGYLTNEVYSYEHEVAEWGKPVRWQLVSDMGYPVYPETLAVRPDRQEEFDGCLDKLVPIMQRSTVDYMAAPGATNELMVQAVEDMGGYPYSMERADRAVQDMTKYGIMGNGDNDTVGELDEERVGRILEIVRPIFEAQDQAVPDDLTAEDLFTNEYIDESIGVG